MATHLSDEEQAERLKRWIRTYGGTALTAVLVVLIAYFGMSYWQKTQQAKQFIVAGQYQKLTEASAAALQNPEDQARQTEFLAAADQLIKDSPDSGYAFHSLLLQAKLAVEQQDYAAAEQA
ncbi:MAG: tetratricopeptide repeat protein, partial [Pseudomonadota bacterium]|nr:tetratricopeptide repeat protein [Pseudomonadota bacterium]